MIELDYEITDLHGTDNALWCHLLWLERLIEPSDPAMYAGAFSSVEEIGDGKAYVLDIGSLKRARNCLIEQLDKAWGMTE